MRRVDTNKEWQTYEARIQDAVFEWPCPIPEDIKQAEYGCRKFLDQCFTEYTIESFYLLGKEVVNKK